MKKIVESFIDWVYPRRCAFCDELLGKEEKYLCEKCREQMPYPISEPRCKKCGKPLENLEQEYCFDCIRQRTNYEWGRGIYLYEGPLKTSLMGLKFNGRKEYGEFLGKLMCFYGKNMISMIKPQVIIPVPIHKKKLHYRGYNQAELLAREVSKGFSIPIRTDLVLRKKFTKAQKELNREERKKNLEKAFEVRAEAGKYQRVLLVDDIYTTGSTVNTISGKLKVCGVEKVYFLTICIGKGM